MTKTAKIDLSNIKCSDGWMEVAEDLGLRDKARDIFEYGEYANLELEIDENLNIIGGRIIPFRS